MPDLGRGAVFAGHRIEGVAGRGGMGVVYRATHLALDHLVALKVISPELADDVRFRRRFESESRIAVSIRHPNVVAVHHAGEEEGLLFVTMDYIEGTDLRGLLNEARRLEPEQALALLEPVASALDAAHSRGLVHRDIKPGNILIERRDGDEHVFLTDFGLTKRIEAESGVTATGAFVGTLDYVAPEQIRGEPVDARADVYALGCVLFEALAGQAPFADRADKVAKMYAHLQDEPPPLHRFAEGLPRALDEVVRRALAKDPEGRFPSAGDLARAARAAIEGQSTVEAERSVATGAAAPARETAELTEPEEPAPAPTAEAVPPLAPDRRRSPWPLIAGLAALVAAAVVAVVVLSGGDGGDGGDGSEPARIAGEPIPVAEMPVSVSAGDGMTWVGSRVGGEVSAIAPDGERVQRDFPLGGAPEGVGVGFGAVWVANGDADFVWRVDPRSGEAEEQHVGLDPGGVAVGDDRIWVAASGSDVVAAVDPESLGAEKVRVGAFPYGVAVGEGSVWVSNREDATVTRIDETSLEPVATIPVGAEPKGLAVAEGSVWVANTGEGTVSRIDPSSNAEEESISVEAEPRDVAYGFGSLWVTNGGDDSVSRIDPASGDVEQTLRVGDGPEDIAAGTDAIWVANGLDDEVVRIEP